MIIFIDAMPFRVIYKFLEFIKSSSLSNDNDDFSEMCFISNKINVLNRFQLSLIFQTFKV